MSVFLRGFVLNEMEREVFDAIDINEDGILDEEEIALFFERAFTVLKISPNCDEYISPTVVGNAIIKQQKANKKKKKCTSRVFHIWCAEKSKLCLFLFSIWRSLNRLKVSAARNDKSRELVPTSQGGNENSKSIFERELIQIRKTCRLEGVDAMDMLSFLPATITARGHITRREYISCFQDMNEAMGTHLIDPTRQEETWVRGGREWLIVLFDVFSSSGDNITFFHFVCILSIVCVGDIRTKLLLVFETADSDDDGHISDHAVLQYLDCLFKLIFTLANKEGHHNLSCSPGEFSRSTWVHAMSAVERGRVAEGLVSFDEFFMINDYIVRTGYNGFFEVSTGTGQESGDTLSHETCKPVKINVYSCESYDCVCLHTLRVDVNMNYK